MPEEAHFPIDLLDENDTAIAKRYIVDEVMYKLAVGDNLTPSDLDVCTLVTPYEFIHLFDDAPMENQDVRTLFDNAEEDPEVVSWKKLALNNGLPDYMVVPYTPKAGRIALVDIYDTPERTALLGLEVQELEELLMQIIRRIWLGEVSITWSRLLAREALVGEAVDIPTQDIARTFANYSHQSDPKEVCIFGYDIYASAEPTTTTTTTIELAVHVPVAAGQERETLPVLISELARQTIDPRKIKTYFVHNRSKAEFSDDDYIEADAQEMAWMRTFYSDIRAKFPHFQFEARYIIGEPSLTIGHIRRKSHLYAIDDYLRKDATNNPLMLNLDADTSQMNAEFMQNILTVAEDSNRPVIATRLGWRTTAVKKEAPTVAKLLKLSSFLSTVAEADRGTPSFFDCGTAIRLRDYCMSGGHIWHDEFYETGEIAHTIRRFAQHKGDLGGVVAASKNSRFKSDPRRQLYTLQQNSAPERAWDPDITTFGEHDDPVRRQSPDLLQLEKQTVATLGELITDMIEINIGWFYGMQTDDTHGRERFMRKKNVIAKGLSLLGLPSLDELI